MLVSQSTRDLIRADDLHDLGEHRLKDLTAPERIYQLGGGEFPPLKTLYHTNFPVQPTPLLGRERELEEVERLLRSTRLLTLTGPGAIGEAARIEGANDRAADSFADALNAFAEIGDDAGVAECLEGLALVGLEQSKLRLLATAEAVRTRYQRPPTRPDRVPSTLRMAARGVQPMNLPEAVALALEPLQASDATSMPPVPE